MSKKLLGNKPIRYLVITNPDGGHQQASSITLKEARKLLKTEGVVVYVFKMPSTMYNKPMFKYPLCEYYNCFEINNYTNDVWTSLNVINKEDKDFTKYIEIICEHNEYNIKYKTI